MVYDVLLKALPRGGYVARVLNLPDCETKGKTREEALSRARRAIAQELKRSEIVRITVPESRNPLDKFAGVFRDDPLFDAVMAEIETYRRQLDAEAVPDAVSA